MPRGNMRQIRVPAYAVVCQRGLLQGAESVSGKYSQRYIARNNRKGIRMAAEYPLLETGIVHKDYVFLARISLKISINACINMKQQL